MTDINSDSIAEFFKKLEKERDELDSLSCERLSGVSEFKNLFNQYPENLKQQTTVIIDEVRNLKNNNFLNSIVRSWQDFDKKVMTLALDCRDHITPDLTPYEMADAYDKATDNDCYRFPAKEFNYRKFLPEVKTESEKSDNKEANSDVNNDNLLFTSNPDIQKRVKNYSRRYKRDLVKPTIKFLKRECEKLTQRTIADIDDRNRKLISRLFIKLSRNSELRPLIWREEYLKAIFGNGAKKILDAFSYPPSAGSHIKNFKEAVDCLKNLFEGTVIADFDFKNIRTDLLKEFLINAFHCYISPLTFNNNLSTEIAEELEDKFGIDWNELMNENSEFMRKNCPERKFSDLFFLGQMGRTKFLESPELLDEKLIDKLDEVAENGFKLIGYPLVFELYSKDFVNFMACYGFNFLILKNEYIDYSNKIKELKKLESFNKNINRMFKRYILLSFVDVVKNCYIKGNVETADKIGIQNQDIEIKNKDIDEFRVKLQKTIPEDLTLYLQPRCRDVLENKIGVEFLGQVYASAINACIYKDGNRISNRNEKFNVLKVVKSKGEYSWNMGEFNKLGEAEEFVRRG